MGKKMVMVILLFFKKRKYYYNREFLSISVWYIFKKKNFLWFNRGNKIFNKVFFSYFNSFCVVFFLSSDSFFIYLWVLWE